jgi:radical SAM protein with 4Fe4S-binding SPASM domain
VVGPGLALRRIADAVTADWRAFSATVSPPPPPSPGLHTLRLVAPDGQGRKRIHLRIEPDGAGVLFVDVTDVIQLNPPAAAVVHHLLHGGDRTVARIILARGDRTIPRRELEQHVDQLAALVARVTTLEPGCPTCDLDFLERKPLFSTRARAPYKADLALTYGCNNACNHCYNDTERLPMPSMPREHWFAVIDKLASLGVPHLIFTGGEATLHPDLVALVAHANAAGMICGLNSNGRRLGHAPFLTALAEAGLDHVQVTLSSHEAELHDAINGTRAFHQTVQGIRAAVDSAIHTITNTTICARNKDTIEETIDFLHSLGIRTFAMNGMIYSGGGFADPDAIPEAEMIPILERIRDHARDRGMRFLWYTPTEYCRLSPVELEIGAKRCNAGEYSVAIEPNGDVLPCQSFYVAAGNILTDPWETIWRGDLFRSFREREEDPAKWGLPSKCHECPDLPLCGGGCRIERDARDGVRTEGPAPSVVLDGFAPPRAMTEPRSEKARRALPLLGE